MGPQRVYRKNTYAPAYIENVVGAYNLANAQNKYNGANEEIAGSAKGTVLDPSISTDGFFGRVRRNTLFAENGSITYGELQMLSPGVDSIAKVIINGAIVDNTPYSINSTSGWNGANYETIEVTNLVQAIPALMMELMISEIDIASTNDTINGMPFSTVQKFNSFTNKIDMRPYIQAFIDRFNNEVMRELTKFGQRKVSLNLIMDLTGSSFIRIQIDNNHAYDFVSPSFCDGVYSPMISNSQGTLQKVTNDFNHIFNNLDTKYVTPGFEDYSVPSFKGSI
jgi:hypothetical protein